MDARDAEKAARQAGKSARTALRPQKQRGVLAILVAGLGGYTAAALTIILVPGVPREPVMGASLLFEVFCFVLLVRLLYFSAPPNTPDHRLGERWHDDAAAVDASAGARGAANETAGASTQAAASETAGRTASADTQAAANGATGETAGASTQAVPPSDSKTAQRAHAGKSATSSSIRKKIQAIQSAEVAKLGLSEKEQDVAILLLQEGTYADIAKQLYLSKNTIKYHARNIYKKVRVTDRNGLRKLVWRRIETAFSGVAQQP